MKEEKMEQYKKEYQSIDIPQDGVGKMKEAITQAKKERRRVQRKKRIIKTITAVAATAACFMLLPNINSNIAYAMRNIPVIGHVVDVVTFRDYHFEDNRNTANVEIPQIVSENVTTHKADEKDDTVQNNIDQSMEEINQEIEELSDKYIAEFQNGLEEEDGYSDLTIQHDVINTTEEYFTLRLVVFQAAGSGSEEHYYYTINLKTGERMQLKDLFKEGADYTTAISDSIKEQMRQQMKKDDMITYWLDDPETSMWNFETISKDQSFYINTEDEIVITFNEGDVAPMYMGCVEFVISQKVVKEIKK